MKNPWIQIVRTVMLLLLVGGAYVTPGYAFQSGGDYWYSETITLGESALPQGIAIIATNPALEARGSLTITNKNEQPVYVMSLGYKDVLVMVTPDANWKNRVNGAQEAASYLAAPSHPAHLSIESLTSLDQSLEDRNVLSSHPPPKDTPLPASQSSELLLVYGGQVIEVPFTITYSLNPQYAGSLAGSTPVQTAGNPNDLTPTSQAVAPASQAAVSRILVVGGLAAGGMILVGVLLFSLLRRKT